MSNHLSLIPASLLFLVASCSALAKRPLVELDANAAWSDDEKEALVVRYSFRPRNSEQPYFNAQDAEDWQIRFEALRSDLRGPRRLLAVWPSESRDGGGIMQRPVYWLRKKKRLIYTETQAPFLHLLDEKRRVELRPPEAVIQRITGPELAPGVSGHSPIPSPDGRLVAVWFNTSYIKGGPLGPQIHTHFVSFFRSRDGAHIHSERLPFRDREFDPWILPRFLSRDFHQEGEAKSSKVVGRPPRPLGVQKTDGGFRYRFLWKGDSSGVYIVTRQESWFLGSSPDAGLKSISKAPRYAVPTRGGPVASDGSYVYIKIDKSRPNQTRLQIRRLPAWTSFENNPIVPVSETSYPRP